ncbi:TonB-dependent receptor [uncultured Oxalicibacterium sp.]|uniref:TonB-dependent receptor n=1 Tax=uncultured Oxalicibacterium sp. TaxID=1168540 RepID=UPI0025F9F75A|nr:TonB-dependent receptor [uncultured Oxalicibacterium sp.]
MHLELQTRAGNHARALHPTPLAHAVATALLSMALGGAVLAPAYAQTNTATNSAVKSYNIPAGPLSQALYSFAGNAGITLSFEPGLTEGLRSNGLHGNYSVQQGLDALLGAHNLEAVAGNGGYRLRRVVQDASTLPAINVATTTVTDLSPAYAGGQIARGGSLGLLGTQNVMDTPFSTNNYTAELLEDQQVRTLADVVVNDASVRMTTGSTGFDDTFQIRGFAVSATDVGFNGLYGLISQNRVPAQLIERVEVLKGPGSLMNGISPNGSVGGGLNIVSKRASDTPLTRLTALYSGKENFGLAIDLGRRFGEDNAWGLRFNGLLRDGEATIDGGNQQTGLAALGIDYRSSRLRWSLDAITQRDDTDNFRPQISLDAGLSSIPAPPDARSNWYPGTTLVQKDSTLATRLEYDLTEVVSVYAGIGYRDGTNDQIFPSTLRTAPVNAAGNFTVQNNYYDSYTKTTSANAGVRWRFNTASVGHTLTAAVTEMRQEAGNAYITGNTAASNIYNPSALPSITSARTSPNKASETTLSSIAIADTLSFANDRLLLTLGVRDQTVELRSFNTSTGIEGTPYKASTASPLAAIVFKPVANVAVYGNYSEGLSRGQIVGAGYANTGAVLAPFKSKQYEVGVKIDFGGITTTAAVYELLRPNAIRNDTNALAYDGEQRNRGLELSAYGELKRGLRGMASIAFVDPKLTRTAGGINQGNDAAGVPDTTASASLDWDAPWLAGLAFNGRVIYTSGSYLNASNTQKFDGWTRYDIGARYRTAINGKPIVLRANIENLLDKNYWLTTGTYVTVGSPRTLVLSASIDF